VSQTTVAFQRNGTHGTKRKCVARVTYVERNVWGLVDCGLGCKRCWVL